MSAETVQHAYLNARLSILASRLLSSGELRTLVETGMANSLNGESKEVAGAGSDDGASVEQTQLSALLEDFRVVVRPLSGTDRNFLIHAIHLFELANLKTIIRGKLAGLDRATIEFQLLDLGSFATLPVEELLRTEDAAEALRRLEATSYFDIARQARRTFEEGHDMFAVDAAIDRHYYVGLKRRAESVTYSQRRTVTSLTGAVMDRTNLMWLLRYRFSYDFSPAATYYQLVPSGAMLTAERLRRLARLPHFRDVVDALPGELGRWVAGANAVADAEDRLEQRMEWISNAALKRSKQPVARAFAYFLRRDLDMRRLIASIKGKRLGLEPALIRIAAHATG